MALSTPTFGPGEARNRVRLTIWARRRPKHTARGRGPVAVLRRRRQGVPRFQVKYSHRHYRLRVGLAGQIEVPAVHNIPIRG